MKGLFRSSRAPRDPAASYDYVVTVRRARRSPVLAKDDIKAPIVAQPERQIVAEEHRAGRDVKDISEASSFELITILALTRPSTCHKGHCPCQRMRGCRLKAAQGQA